MHRAGSIPPSLHQVQFGLVMLLLGTRQHTAQCIGLTLREWMAAIPTELHPERLSILPPKQATRYLVSLYFAHLACFFKIHKVGSHDAEWLNRLVDYSQRIVASTELDTTTAAYPFLEPSPAWPEVVDVARECGRLFRTIELHDSQLRWYVDTAVPWPCMHPPFMYCRLLEQ